MDRSARYVRGSSCKGESCREGIRCRCTNLGQKVVTLRKIAEVIFKDEPIDVKLYMTGKRVRNDKPSNAVEK